MSQEGPILSRLLPIRTGGSYGHPHMSGKHPATAPPPGTGTNATRLSAHTQFLARGMRIAHHTHDAR